MNRNSSVYSSEEGMYMNKSSHESEPIQGPVTQEEHAKMLAAKLLLQQAFLESYVYPDPLAAPQRYARSFELKRQSVR